MIPVVIYVRYSSTAQREESAEIQINSCNGFAEREGYIVVDVYKDEALTGRTDDRPQFQKMISDSKKGLFQKVIVHRLDRFSRDKFDNAHYKRILKKNGVKVLSATETIPDDSTGVLMEYILEGFAEYYSVELSEKVKRGHYLNAEKFQANGACVPLGYKIVDKKYVIDEETAPIVVEIFTKYADGVSVKQICDDLNARQLKSSRGAAFNKNSLHYLLKNEKYIGVYIYGTFRAEGEMPRIIDDELFNRVAEQMAYNKKAPARSKAEDPYLLSEDEKIFCGHCKDKMTGNSVKKIAKTYKYYKCNSSGGKKPCKKKTIGKEHIENIVVDECLKLLTPENIRRIAKEVMKVAKKQDDRSEIIRLEKCLKDRQIEQKNQTTTLRACDSDVVRDLIISDLEIIAADIKELEIRLKIEIARRENISEKQVINFLTKLANGDIMDETHRKALIKSLVNKIYLYDDKFTVHFNSGDDKVTIDDVLFENTEKFLAQNNLDFKEVSAGFGYYTNTTLFLLRGWFRSNKVVRVVPTGKR